MSLVAWWLWQPALSGCGWMVAGSDIRGPWWFRWLWCHSVGYAEFWCDLSCLVLGEVTLIGQEARAHQRSAGTSRCPWMCFLIFSSRCLLLVIRRRYGHGILSSLCSSLVLLGSFLFLLASLAQGVWAFFGWFFCWVLALQRRRITR